MKAFLMMGQSNMAGRGHIGTVPPIKNPNCFVLRMGRWQQLTEPINVDRGVFANDTIYDLCSGINPGGSFADSYQKYYGEQVGLIPCADGGTTLADWKIDGQLFLHAYYQAKLAMNVSEIVGIIWHQGESDSNTEEKAFSYKERFLTIMDEFQNRLGLNLDIVVGELGYYLDDYAKPLPYWRDINKTLHELAHERDNIAIATAEGLEDCGDKLHFSAIAQREFGKRYFEAYKNLRERQR